MFPSSPFPPSHSTILAEEKAQQEERSRMEMRRQVTVSWDSGGSDEAPPKVSVFCFIYFFLLRWLCYCRSLKQDFTRLSVSFALLCSDSHIKRLIAQLLADLENS